MIQVDLPQDFLLVQLHVQALHVFLVWLSFPFYSKSNEDFLEPFSTEEYHGTWVLRTLFKALSKLSQIPQGYPVQYYNDEQ
jgi:hypothetical protein